MGASETFSSLKYPNYRLWFTGQTISMFGSWMQITALGFLVYQLTGSSLYLGYMGFATGVPALLLTLLGGVYADRVHRRSLLVLTQGSMALLAFALAYLTFSGEVEVWHVFVIGILNGVANAFDAPCRKSFIIEMVNAKDATNAIALNSVLYNLSMATGPAAAGVVFALFGPAWCFLINGISFVAVIVALIRMRGLKFHPVTSHTVSADLAELFYFMKKNRMVVVLLAMVSLLVVMDQSLITLLPAWSVTVLNGDATTNGLLQSAKGAGALIGAFAIAALSHFKFRGRILFIGVLYLPLALTAFAVAPDLLYAMLGLAMLYFVRMILIDTDVSVMIDRTPNLLRGRIMSMHSLVIFGVMPFASLLAGWLAEKVGERQTILIIGLTVCTLLVTIWLREPRLRRIA